MCIHECTIGHQGGEKKITKLMQRKIKSIIRIQIQTTTETLANRWYDMAISFMEKKNNYYFVRYN